MLKEPGKAATEHAAAVNPETNKHAGVVIALSAIGFRIGKRSTDSCG